MFSVTYAQLNVWLTSFLWPFTRILALIATAPMLSHQAIPIRVKVAIAAFIALIVAPTIGAVPQVTVFSADGVMIIINQFLVGAALGMTMQIAFGAIDAAGEFIGMQMGLGFATLYDPRRGQFGGDIAVFEHDCHARVPCVRRPPANDQRPRADVPERAGERKRARFSHVRALAGRHWRRMA